MRDTRLSKCKPCIIVSKSFCEQAFLKDLNLSDWTRVNLIPEPELELQYFKSLFLDIINKHAPLRKYKIKGRNNPWFSEHATKQQMRREDYPWSGNNAPFDLDFAPITT